MARLPLATVTLDSATWAALALTLTLIGAALTVVAYRRRGLAAGLRGLAWTLVPVAAWLTGTLRLATDVANSVLDWASRLVFSPSVWAGVVVAGVSAALFLVSGRLRARTLGRARTARSGAGPAAAPAGGAKREVAPGRGRPAMGDDDDMAEIEAILRKHGI